MNSQREQNAASLAAQVVMQPAPNEIETSDSHNLEVERSETAASNSNTATSNKASKVVIIGAGPAGLTAAYQLCKVGVPCVVLERDNDVGGISRTVSYRGYRFDIGGHRFYTKVAAVNALWNEIMPPGEFLRRKRISRIYYNRKFFHYPILAGDALKKLGVVNMVLIVLSYVRYRLFPMQPADTFEANICNRFGRRLFETFFKTYTEKVWGVPCSQITSEWANQRIKDFGLGQAIKQALKSSRFGRLRRTPKTRKGKPQDEGVIKTLIESFEYPRLGPGQMWQCMAQRVRESGGEVRLASDAGRVIWDVDRVVAVEICANDQVERVEGSHFISSMPIRTLIHKLDPPPPDDVVEAASHLKYRDFLTVALIINRAHLFADNWIYIHDPTVKVGRIQNFKNWSPDMVADESKTCLGLEYFCFEGDGLWAMPDGDLVELAKREIAQLGLAAISEIEDGTVVRQPKAYPVYDSGYQDALVKIRAFLSTLSNFQLIGRNGMHRYNNQDHSMLTAMLAVENILGAHHDLWQVNADQEYGEEASTDLREQYAQLNATQPPVPVRIAPVDSLTGYNSEQRVNNEFLSKSSNG